LNEESTNLIETVSHIRIKVPVAAQAIREAFRANLEERQKKLNQSY